MRHRINTDGKGVTSLVGLTGCPLSCKYCLNKEVLKAGAKYEASAEELLSDVMQDACYMIATGGGITFGGGEPLLQYEDILEFAEIKPDWMQVNIETSLHAPAEVVSMLTPYVSRWIVDVKTLDEHLYEQYTGCSSDMMKENLEILRQEALDRFLIRVPIIPGIKARDIADSECEILRQQGFNNIDEFEYVIRN
jgi:pyruvate formate lyase activating enzyme